MNIDTENGLTFVKVFLEIDLTIMVTVQRMMYIIYSEVIPENNPNLHGIARRLFQALCLTFIKVVSQGEINIGNIVTREGLTFI